MSSESDQEADEDQESPKDTTIESHQNWSESESPKLDKEHSSKESLTDESPLRRHEGTDEKLGQNLVRHNSGVSPHTLDTQGHPM